MTLKDQSFVCVHSWNLVIFKFWGLLENTSEVILVPKLFYFRRILNFVRSFVECKVSLADSIQTTVKVKSWRLFVNLRIVLSSQLLRRDLWGSLERGHRFGHYGHVLKLHDDRAVQGRPTKSVEDWKADPHVISVTEADFQRVGRRLSASFATARRCFSSRLPTPTSGESHIFVFECSVWKLILSTSVWKLILSNWVWKLTSSPSVRKFIFSISGPTLFFVDSRFKVQCLNLSFTVQFKGSVWKFI
jgi:hypothetical protein